LRKLAANVVLRQDIAAEFNIEVSDLGTLAKPGDSIPVEEADDEDEPTTKTTKEKDNENSTQ